MAPNWPAAPPTQGEPERELQHSTVPAAPAEAEPPTLKSPEKERTIVSLVPR